MNKDTYSIGGHEFESRFILGSGKFSLDLVKACIEKAQTQIVTLALRRANEGGMANILDYIPDNVTLLIVSQVEDKLLHLGSLKSGKRLAKVIVIFRIRITIGAGSEMIINQISHFLATGREIIIHFCQKYRVILHSCRNQLDRSC